MRIFAIVLLVIAALLCAASLVGFVVIGEVAVIGLIAAFGVFTLGVGAQVASRRR